MAGSPLLSRRDVLATTAAAAATGVASRLLADEASVPSHLAAASAALGPSGKDRRIRQSLCAWCYYSEKEADQKKGKFSKAQLIKTALELGYVGIDLVGPEWFKDLKDAGLIATMVPGNTDITTNINRKENWERCLAGLRRAIDDCSTAGFERVICFSGNRGAKGREPISDEEGMQNCADAISQIVGEAEKKKVVLCMELLNSRVNHPDYMCDNSRWGIDLCKRVGSEHFKLLYDIYHMQIDEGNVIDTITKHHQYFAHYHTAGVPGRHEIDDSQELNYAAIMRAIAKTGHAGYVAQEFLCTRDPVASLKQAYETCNV